MSTTLQWLRGRPFVTIFAFQCLGIFLSYRIDILDLEWYVLGIFIISLAVLSVLRGRIFAGLMSILVMLFGFYGAKNHSTELNRPVKTESIGSRFVIDRISPGKKNLRLTVKYQENNDWRHLGRINMYLKSRASLKNALPGDTLVYKKPIAFKQNRVLPGNFDFQAYFLYQHVVSTVFIFAKDTIELIPARDIFSMRRIARKCHNGIHEILQACFLKRRT